MILRKSTSSDSDFPLHRRQFLITKENFFVFEGWRCISVASGKAYLHHHPDLEVKIIHNTSTRQNYVLIGNIYQTDYSRPAIEYVISTCTPEQISNYLDQCAGRWVVIAPSEIKMDAIGLLGLYYCKHQEIEAVSSSVSLLAHICKRNSDMIPLNHTDRINWRVSPDTGIIRISQLLNDQYVRISFENGFEVLSFNPFIKLRDYGEEDMVNVIRKRLLGEISSITKKQKKIYVALSSGYDSRLITSLLIHVGADFEMYTQVHKYMSWGDRTIPQRIASFLGKSYLSVATGRLSEESLTNYNKHASWQVAEQDNYFFAQGQWEWLDSESIALRGGVINCFRTHHYERIFQNQNNEISASDQKSVFKDNISCKNLLVKWYDVQKNKGYLQGLTQNAFFHYQQRGGAWLSKIEQGLDLLSGTSLHIGNTRELMSIAVKMSEAQKADDRIPIKIIQSLVPDLLKFPFNPPNPLAYKIYLKFLKLVHSN